MKMPINRDALLVESSKSGPLPLNLLVAHALEAKALIALFQLQPVTPLGRFPEYSNAKGLHLIVAGIGKTAVVDAIAYLATQQHSDLGQCRGWLNIGIAGHRSAAIGSAYIANKITDFSTAQTAYPPQLIEGFDSCSVITVNAPERCYPSEAVYEMEASAFYAQATKHAPAELVLVYKIVSDNLENSIADIDFKKVPDWIAAGSVKIARLIDKLAALVVEYNAYNLVPAAYQNFKEKLHLTVNKDIKLKRLCQRFKAMGREQELQSHVDFKNADGKQLIKSLTYQLEHVNAE